LYWSFKKENDNLEKNLVIKGFSDLKSKREVSEIYDVSMKTINEFLNLARSGFSEFEEVLRLYENKLIPYQIDIFMKSIVNKPLNKALKDSKLTIDELEYYYELGKNGEGRFKKFYRDYLDLKTKIYASAILDRKSSKIALKNSNLTVMEFSENEEKINDLILTGRFNIMADELEKHKSSGSRLAKVAGVSVEEVYDWYFRGKDGDEKYRKFAVMFELGVILPRSMALRHAMELGVPKNKLHKKLKKDIGLEEYNIWDRHGIIDKRDLGNISIDGTDIDEKTILKLVRNSEFLQCCSQENDPETFEFMKMAVKGNSKFKKQMNHISKNRLPTISKSEIMGK
jgi:transposase